MTKGWLYRPSPLLLHILTGGNVTTFFTGIKLVPNKVPEKFSLGQNYTNPFNPTTKIAYDIPRDAKVKLVIYEILGVK